jgi:hypothetical protein
MHTGHDKLINAASIWGPPPCSAICTWFGGTSPSPTSPAKTTSLPG